MYYDEDIIVIVLKIK